MQGVTVQVETDEESNKITYVLQNHTTEEVDYDGIPALEYRDGQSWQEVMTKLGNRGLTGGRTAIGYFIAPMGTVSGEVDLESLPRLKDGAYRLVFPGVWENDPVICSEPFSGERRSRKIQRRIDKRANTLRLPTACRETPNPLIEDGFGEAPADWGSRAGSHGLQNSPPDCFASRPFEPCVHYQKQKPVRKDRLLFLERLTRLELATSTLARWRSTR